MRKETYVQVPMNTLSILSPASPDIIIEKSNVNTTTMINVIFLLRSNNEKRKMGISKIITAIHSVISLATKAILSSEKKCTHGSFELLAVRKKY